MNDVVLTHEHHPDLCGVAKFSERLATRLGVSCHRMISNTCESITIAAPLAYPLLSVKGRELARVPTLTTRYDVFAHDADDVLRPLIDGATRVFAANRVIARQWRTIRPDVIAAWCPSLIQGDDSRASYNVLTFGMAHKLQIAQYLSLKRDLDAEHGDDYTVRVSTAVHEGSPWDATADVADQLRWVFGSKLRVLGYLADDALVREMHEADAVALFFPDGVRENNTTYWAAVEHGKRIITNRDADSPTGGAHRYTWDRLTELITHAA